MEEFLSQLFLSYEKVLLPGFELHTLDWKHRFLSTDQLYNDAGKCNFLVIIFQRTKQ